MTSRINTRGQVGKVLANKTGGLKVQNENLARPPLPGKAGASSFLRDTTNKVLGLKRKADGAPDEEKATKKRSAFGDITNAIEKKINDGKKVTAQKGRLMRSASTKSLVKPLSKPAAAKDKVPAKTAKAEVSAPEVKTQAKEISFCDSLPSSQDTVFSSQESKTDLDDSAAYVTASEGRYCLSKASLQASVLGCSLPVKDVVEKAPVVEQEPVSKLPEGVEDYDKEMENDPFAVSLYAQDIFEYYKGRESNFVIDKYIDRQPDVSRSMRAILIDWMVEVQESFELNHETLYLAVKIIDLYLAKTVIKRDVLQLVGSTAMFIACKFDERTPPYVDDFLYICDDAYKRKELIEMEIKILKVIGFDLGVPLSYRFLRRYARCAKVSMEDLTLTRYILEMSLMDYELLDASDSALAAAALLLTRIIRGDSTWTPTLQYYSGYSMEDIYHLVHHLHQMISQPPKEHLKTIRNKYSHKVFFEVAKIPIPETLNI
ncbi:G2/mitotic-specific cyclin-B3-like [Penaeus monodon]|uniref:G2/mitotic-specific cyclin-B3-like n=1 Tax=Penaeus monodon TaxID=6687 RepID=UPI0018A7C1A5|nr:G2/mitotic-specific cyclin-B3-like [Penaeus monodon]